MSEQVKIGYARVSTLKQDLSLQKNQLEAAGCSEVFEDFAVSGSRNVEAEGFQNMLARVSALREAGTDVVVVVSKLDRFSRSLGALISSVERLGAMGASFRALDGAFEFDAGSSHSKLMLHILGALAEFERSLIVGRMSEGLAAKVERGLLLGPKPKLRDAAVASIREGYAGGKSVRRLSKEWAVARSTIMRVVGTADDAAGVYISLDDWERAKIAAG